MTLTEINFDVLHPQPLLIVISGPSGVGKDSVLKEMKKRSKAYAFITTATSREPRPNEVHGVDYFFVSKAEFERMIAADELIEYNLVYSDYKGIPKSQVQAALATGQDTVIRVDVQGAMRLKTLCPEAVFIFLVPDNAAVWYHRLKNRKTETDEEFALRIKTAKAEMEHLDWFDYVVVNTEDCLENTVDTIEAIITAEHHRSHHRVITL
ncbi:MAG: guanylate kinase [Anaerolineae bacterium]|nr:guanylate kinase [Anaerolineae bacterium]